MTKRAESLSVDLIRSLRKLDRHAGWVVTVATLLYAVTFPYHRAVIFGAIPVVAAGWFYYTRGGWIAGIAAIFFDFLVLRPYQGQNFLNDVLQYELKNFFLLEHFFTLMAGIVIGRLRELLEAQTRTKEALVASEERFRSLYENATIGIYSTTPDGNILLANPVLVQMLGYDSFDELVSRNLDREGFGKERPRREFQEHIEKEGFVRGMESEWIRKDGAAFFVRESARAIRDAKGNTLRYEGTVEDITEQKHTEKALQEREIRLKNILESATDAIITLDQSQNIISFSRSAEAIFGYQAGEVIGKSLDMLLPQQASTTHRHYVEQFANREEQTLSLGHRREISGRRKNGVEFPAEASISKFVVKDNLIFAVFLRDITERKKAERELQDHANFLSILNEMTQTIIGAQDFKEIAEDLTRNISALLKADSCYITRWDPVKGQVFPIATNNIASQFYSGLEYPKNETNLTLSVLNEKRIIVVEDPSVSPYINPSNIRKFTEKSFVGIPLIYGGHKLGAVILGFNHFRPYNQSEMERARQAGHQIALAFWNMQQDAELKRSLSETKTLTDISTALSESERIGLENVLQMIVNSAQNLISNAEQTVIHLLDEKEQILSSAAVAGFTNPEGGKKNIRIGKGVAGQVILSGETINIEDVNTDPRFVKLGSEPSYQSLLVAPIHSGERKLGTISIQSKDTQAFTANDVNLLNQLGTQAAIAIENANLLESTKQALKEANALYRVNKGLAASLEPDDLLQDTVELLQKNFDYHYVQIFVADSESGNFIMRAGSGKIGAQLKARGHQLAPGEGIVGYTAETGAAFFTNDVDDIVSFARTPLLPDTKSELAVPVKVGGDTLGLLDIHQVPPKTLSHRDLQLVSAVADQLAVALQKADLYESLQISLQQEKAIRNQLMQNERLAVMGKLLATVSHELNNPLQAIQNALFLLKEENGISTQGKQDLNIVLAESERMASMIERLRATYRPIQADDFQPTQINDIVEDVYALISTHLRHKQIAFEFHPDPELPEIPALADQIRQVALNLLMNAVEAMTSGGTISVCTQFLRESDEILLTVADTGPGVPADLLPNVFEAFVTNKPSGTGLGLTISYDIVMKHRGRIIAENNKEQGAIFKVWLPANNGEIL